MPSITRVADICRDVVNADAIASKLAHILELCRAAIVRPPRIPVGASLLAMTACQPTSILCVLTKRRASAAFGHAGLMW